MDKQGALTTISEQELSRYRVLQLVLSGQISLVDAARSLGVTYRHAKRLKKRAERGLQAMAHGNRGRPPSNKMDERTRATVLTLSQETYSSFNDAHFTELLAEKEGIVVSRETARAMRREAGIRPKRKRRQKKHHRRRERKPAEGLMALWDGSPHRWFGKDRPACCLMAAMDDATGKVLELLFAPYEGSWAYLKLLEGIVSRYGIPVSVYQDKHSALKRNDDFWSIDEQLEGRQYPTQVGAALEALGIKAIFANSPQAKGRIERLFGTLQDRLVAELELEGITDPESANAFVHNRFLEEFNARFAQEAEDSVSVWRKVGRLDLNRILSFRYEATVGNDNAIRYAGMVIDVPPGPGGQGYAGVRAELRQLLDGSWRVYHKDKLITTCEATEIAEPILAKRRRNGSRAAADSVWVYMQSAPENTQPQQAESLAKTAVGSVRRAGPGGAIGATRIA
jgi:transposase